LHHVIWRAIERRKIFWGDCDRDDFSERLEAIVRETQTACCAWAMMIKPFQLVLRIGNTPIAGVTAAFERLRRKVQSHAPAERAFVSKPLQTQPPAFTPGAFYVIGPFAV
jgi:hypothetical protein